MKLITVTSLHRKRIMSFIILMSLISVVVTLVLYALNENINLFYTPSEISQSYNSARSVKLGGMVVNGSIVYKDGMDVSFTLTDFKETVNVSYKGILPDLFKEGQGIVTEGNLREDGIFIAKKVFAKHDEKYMPPNIKGASRDT